MGGLGKFKLADLLGGMRRKLHGGKAGKPLPTQQSAAENTRAADESEAAANARVSTRERMVNIGRGNQQAGRQGQ